jgi:hypothetical protein
MKTAINSGLVQDKAGTQLGSESLSRRITVVKNKLRPVNYRECSRDATTWEFQGSVLPQFHERVGNSISQEYLSWISAAPQSVNNCEVNLPYDKIAGSILIFVSARSRRSSRRVEMKFNRLYVKWKTETEYYSSIRKKISNPHYQEIITMGSSVLPFILKLMMEEPQHWFVALKEISGENPVPYGASFEESRLAWLEWGKSKKLI